MRKNVHKSRLISIITLIITSFILLFSYKQYDEYITINEKYNDIKRSTEEELEIYMYSLLNENVEKAELYMNEFTNEINEDIYNEYGKDLVGLQDDIDYPTEDSKLSEIFDRHLGGLYINRNTNKNKAIVMSQENILWDRSLGVDKNEKKYLSIDDLIKEHYNIPLSKNAKEAILNVNSRSNNFIFWEVLPNTNKNHKMIDKMDISNLIDVYKTEGIEGIKSYSLLVPTYISKDGDIFGNKDISSLGFKNKNYKIIIIQRLSVYDILKEDLYRISFFENEIDKLDEEILEINNKKVFNMLESIGWIIVVISISALLQKKSNDEDEEGNGF